MSEDELLDMCDEAGRSLGVATRAQIHARGVWHRTLHLWLAFGSDALLYQLRSSRALNWPCRLDASVAGHLLAGETYLDALREAREEIGVVVPRAAVNPLGIRMEAAHDSSGDNRELQGVYLAAYDRKWGAFNLRDGEAAGLFAIRHVDALWLHRGLVDDIVCRGWAEEGGRMCDVRRTFTRRSFVPRSDEYYLGVHAAAQLLSLKKLS